MTKREMAKERRVLFAVANCLRRLRPYCAIDDNDACIIWIRIGWMCVSDTGPLSFVDYAAAELAESAAYAWTDGPRKRR
jgi:hypothetical protein